LNQQAGQTTVAARSNALAWAERSRLDGRPRDAVAAYRRHLATHPRDADASYWCAYSLWELGELDSAAAEFKKTAKLEPTWPTVPNCLGSVYRRLGQLQPALEAYRQAIKISPDFGPAHANLADLLWELGNLREAAVHFRQAIECEPEWPELYENLAHVLAGQGLLAEANMAVRESIRLDGARASAHCALATILSERGKHAEADATLVDLLDLFPDDASLWSQLGSLRWSAGRYPEAKTAAEAALARDPLLAYPHFLLGELAQRQQDHAQAASHYRRYLELDPADSEGAALALSHLGLAPAPDKAPPDYLKQIYAQRATFWDRTVEDEKPYRGPLLVAQALERVLGTRAKRDILDAGCGTGLCAPLLRPRARKLDGVDLSAHMIEKARERNLYDDLTQGDLETVLRARPQRYDVIASAATLIHFGDLAGPLAASAVALRPGGLMAFTLFPHEGEGVAVLSNHCHGHSRAHIHDRAGAAGFEVVSIGEDVHEYYEGKPVNGLIVTLRRQS
jgi:predicted TPR repeat methyltransferase